MRLVTAAQGTKRFAIAAVALAGAAFVALIGSSFLIPTATIRDSVRKQIQAATGLDPVLRGEVSVSLFPHAAVTFHDVVLGGTGVQPLATAGKMIARLRYFPLLAGDVEIANVTLLRPTINVTFASDGRSNWSGLTAALAQAVEPNPGRAASFSEIGIHDGTVIVRDDERQITQLLHDVEFQVAWPSISRSFAANGLFVWHGEPVNTSLTLSDFEAALTGRSSGAKLRLASAPLDVTFDGTASGRPALKVDGTLNIDSPSLRDALRWTGKQELPFGGFRRFALRAGGSVDKGVISLTDANVELDGNRAEGVLTFATDGRHAIEATLASDSLDLSPYIAGTRLMAGADRTWDRLPITLDGLSDLDLDLRLSAASIKVAHAQFGRTAVAADVHSGKLAVTIGESQSFGGVVTGSFGIGGADNGVEVNSNVQFTDVDLASCLSQLFGLHKLDGRGSVALDVSGSGPSVWALTHTLTGTASVNAHDGALAGINVEELLRRLEKRPLSGNGDFRSGRTPFDKLALNISINHGMMNVDNLHIDGPAVRLTMTGQASVPSRDLDLAGTATLVSTASANEFDLPFVVQGPWDNPIMLPDASSLIRRSNAAAPLLEAVKRHSAGEAVRSVIDQLFAAPQVTPAPAVSAMPPSKTAPAGARHSP
jgi:AsmA protein